MAYKVVSVCDHPEFDSVDRITDEELEKALNSVHGKLVQVVVVEEDNWVNRLFCIFEV